jgi:hypothetical protein
VQEREPEPKPRRWLIRAFRRDLKPRRFKPRRLLASKTEAESLGRPKPRQAVAAPCPELQLRAERTQSAPVSPTRWEPEPSTPGTRATNLGTEVKPLFYFYLYIYIYIYIFFFIFFIIFYFYFYFLIY